MKLTNVSQAVFAGMPIDENSFLDEDHDFSSSLHKSRFRNGAAGTNVWVGESGV